MSNTHNTDTSKTPQQRTPSIQNVKANDAQPAKVEASKSANEGHRQPTGQPKHTIVENAPGTSRR
jgi:hypothetical protein